jgi:hypothetical protein
MPLYSRFDISTGRFLGTREGQATSTLDFPLGEIILEGGYDAAHWLVDGEIERREVPAPPPTQGDVRSECRRRILARYPLEEQVNALRGVAEVDFAWIDAVREAGQKIRRHAVIPADFADDRHWPATPKR